MSYGLSKFWCVHFIIKIVNVLLWICVLLTLPTFTVICLNKLCPFSFIVPSELNLKVTYSTSNTLVSYFFSLKVLTHFSCLETRLIWMLKMCKYHIFHDILEVFIFLKKTVTSTKSLLIERVTYRDMFHKNL